MKDYKAQLINCELLANTLIRLGSSNYPGPHRFMVLGDTVTHYDYVLVTDYSIPGGIQSLTMTTY